MKNLILSFTRPNTWLSRKHSQFGWGNGYVLLPESHKYHKVEYDNIHDIDIHGGITFSELVDKQMCDDWGLPFESIGMWCLGFDTAHSGDTLDNWTKEKVEQETESFRKKLENL